MMRTITAVLFLMLAAPALMFGASNGKQYSAPAHPDTSAPDAWGYTYVKSTDPGGPTFQWIDISTRGTLVTGLLDDNAVGPFDMLWSFPYYWYSANRFKVGSNGYITFDNTTTAFAPPFAQCPNTSLPNDLMAICVGDLVFAGQTGAAGQCYYWTNGVDSLVVSFLNVTEWESTIVPTNTHTFQVILTKRDSSITYQYGPQRGRYNTTNNTRLCIGIENQTGQIGLNYVYSTTPPHALMPDSGLAIKIKRTVNTGLQVIDAGVVGGLNAQNIGKMLAVGKPDSVRCVVKNYGTANLTNVRVTSAISMTGQTTLYDTVFIASMAAGVQQTVVFPRLFTPPVAGIYSDLFNVFVTGDVGPGNNSKTASIVASNFAVGQTTTLAFEGGVTGTSQSWIGGGGYGVAYDLPVYPVRIESLYVSVSAITAQPMIVQIMDGSSGVPGAVLAQRSINAVVGMNGVDFRSDSITVTGGRFFIGATGQITFNLSTTAPISYRTWEYTGGWNPYRTGDQQDVIMRCTARLLSTPTTNWTSQTSGLTSYLYSVKTVNQTTAWAAGATAKVLRTTNGGTTWTNVGGGAIGTADIYNIDAVDANTAFVTTSPSATFIYKTTNGGTTWTQVYTDATTGAFIDAIKMFNSTTGFAIGDPVGGKWVLLKTTDGGATWARDTAHAPVQVGGEGGTQNGLCAVGSSNIWFNSGVGGRIYKTTDGGTTWTSGIAPFAATSNVWFNNALSGIATGSSANAVARSTDGGATWSSVTTAGTGFLIACSGSGINDFWYSRGTTVYKSIDGGQTFNSAYVGTGSYVGLSFATAGVNVAGWAVTSTGGIAAYSQVTTAVDEHGIEIPADFALLQNYPNPFNPTTSIHYVIPRSAQVSLKVYNLLGQEVALLKNEIQSAGTHEVFWNGRNNMGQITSSGVYFYRMQAKPVDGSKEFNSVRKMLLLK